MPLQISYQDIALDRLVPTATEKHDQGWRCVQMLCCNTEQGIDLTYTYELEGTIENYRIRGVQKSTAIPSIQNLFLSVFPFENEAHDLFGVDVHDMALDFDGNFYKVAEKEPMTVISPAQKAAREKAAKIAKAKAAKEAGNADVGKVDNDAMEAKLASMDPEKAAKVRAAMEAKAKRDAEKQKGGDE